MRTMNRAALRFLQDRNFAMISCSHWGMYPEPQQKFSAAWYNEIREKTSPRHIHLQDYQMYFGEIPNQACGRAK